MRLPQNETILLNHRVGLSVAFFIEDLSQQRRCLARNWSGRAADWNPY
jgi:hypothetical protein